MPPGAHRAARGTRRGLDARRAARPGCHGVAGAAVPLVGGCAGDDLRMVATRQFFGADVLTDAVAGAAIGPDAPFGIGVRHGWRRVGAPLMVSSSGGNRVELHHERPALDA